MISLFSNYYSRGTSKDQQIILNLSNAFQNNKRMFALVGHRKNNFKKGLSVLMSYCYFMVKKIDGIFVSSNKSTYLLYYKKSKLHFNLFDRLHYVYMAIFVIGIKRLPNVYMREKLVNNIRQTAIKRNGDKDYWYIWFMAQNIKEKSINGLLEAKNKLLLLTENSNLPVYIETTEERLVPIYERVGFQFYTCKVIENTDLKIWFGRMAAQ